MELLGFYDQPYQVAVQQPARPRKVTGIVNTRHAPVAARDSSERVSALWETTEVDETALDWWKPEVIARRKLGGRRIRTSTTVALLLASAGLAFLLFSLLQRPEQAARESLAAVEADARALLGVLPRVEEVAVQLADAEPPDLSRSTQTVLEAESAARDLFADAGSQEGSRREAAVAGAAAVLDSTSRINRLLAYRLATEQLLSVPALPTDPAGADLPAVTGTVASWRAEIETAVAELATDVLPAHSTALTAWLDGLDTWQAGYLDALRLGDAAATVASVEELETQIAGLRQGLLDHLAEAGGELRQALADARKSTERLLGG